MMIVVSTRMSCLQHWSINLTRGRPVSAAGRSGTFGRVGGAADALEVTANAARAPVLMGALLHVTRRREHPIYSPFCAR